MTRVFNEVMLGSIELFCLCAEQGSFSGAAVVAGVTPAAVSRSIARLEARLGVTLFARTTRRVSLTDAGYLYFQRCKEVLGQLADAERELAGNQLSPSGVVRISIPTPFGHFRILPLIPAFNELYPDVRLEVQLSNQNVDLTGQFDLAIRGRNIPDSSLIARHLEDAKLVTVAAPAYLAKAGIPETLDDLDKHNCIQFQLPSTGQPIPWLYRTDGREIDKLTSGTVCFSEDILGAVSLARHGGGLMQTYDFCVQERLNRGELVEILPHYKGSFRPFSLLYSKDRHMPIRVKKFIEFLIEQLGANKALPE
ncbi:LysR family transcriptional regulator [Cellvibrio zantedeschiae]|uniref:LysR family transcriptional regulator n=1 Tax=Cellvibrio zantedeschiae TaxID=1237077 RepID=A0ABQ3AND8_9GAMM|nr:LysR family transcriptional regulator [Cellvibrio zantedeschiae]GGY62059.1 LysR family transcriptional regulator [Cellvibrio zantedeschiae]